MNLGSRNSEIAMDFCCGMTYVMIGLKHEVHHSRAHQICRGVFVILGLSHHKRPSIEQFKAALFAYRSTRDIDSGHKDTPKGFYNQVSEERLIDEQSMLERLRENHYQP